MARKIVITSGKGGVGKTTIVANVGLQVALKGERVLLMDVDIGLNNLDVASGIEKRVMYDIVDVVERKCRINQAIIRDDYCFDLYYMPTAHIYNTGKITVADINRLINDLDNMFDYIFIDCPAGIDIGFYRAIYSASEAILVTTPQISSIRDAEKVLSILAGQNLATIGLIVNRVRWDLVKRGKYISPSNISECLRIPLLGSISESDNILSMSSVNGKIFTYQGQEACDFILLSEKILNNTYYNNENLIKKIKRGAYVESKKENNK